MLAGRLSALGRNRRSLRVDDRQRIVVDIFWLDVLVKYERTLNLSGCGQPMWRVRIFQRAQIEFRLLVATGHHLEQLLMLRPHLIVRQLERGEFIVHVQRLWTVRVV